MVEVFAIKLCFHSTLNERSKNGSNPVVDSHSRCDILCSIMKTKKSSPSTILLLETHTSDHYREY